jgi:hypothetical protein
LTLIFWLIKKHLLSVDTGLSPKINLRGGDVVSCRELVVSLACNIQLRHTSVLLLIEQYPQDFFKRLGLLLYYFAV